MGKTEVSTIKTDRVTTVYFILLAVSLFFAYPRALLYPPGISNESHFLNWFGSKVSLEDIAVPFFNRFPIEVLVGTISIFYLALSFISFKKFPRKSAMSLILFLLAIGGSVLVNGGLPEKILGKINYVLVPLAVGLAVMKSGLFGGSREKIIQVALFLLWSVSVVWSFLSERPVGISGNQNWFASIILVSAPWAFFFIYHNFRKILSRFCNHVNENFIAAFLALAIVLPVTFYWLLKCQSRAVWVSLVCFAVFGIISQFKLKGRIIGLSLLLVICAASFFAFKTSVKSAYLKDIRGPLWVNTVRMIAESPGVGWGPGKFQEKYLKFKTRDHSSRLVAAPMTEHPHNEFLYLAAEIGLPSALIWLSFVLILLFQKVRSREGHLAKYGFFILFVLSMFDKTLISPPGNILFWFFAGILIAGFLKDVLILENSNKAWKGGVAVCSLLCFIPISMRVSHIATAKEIHRKAALFEKSVSLSKATGEQRKSLYTKVYNSYLKAFEKDPFQIEYPYMALHIAVEILRDTALAEFPLQKCLEINPYYGHLNYLGALYHFQKMHQVRFNKQEAKKHYEQAEKYISIELSLYPDNLASLSHVLEFFLKMRKRDSANNIFNVINDRAVSMYNRKFAGKNDTGKELLEAWISQVKKDKMEALESAQSILSGFKGIGGLDLMTPFYAAQEGYMIGHNHETFHSADLKYWREIEQFSEFYKNEASAESLCRTIMNTVKLSDHYKFLWPSEVLAKKAGNDLSIACLLRIAAHCQGHLSLLIKIQTLDKVHWLVYVKNEKEEFICYPGAGKIYKKKIAQFLGDSKFIEEMIGDKIKKTGLFLFEYPQAFCFRNVLLSKIVNRTTGKFPDFCSTPSVVKLNLEFFLGGKFAIDYLRQPFHRLEEDIKQEKK